MPGAGTVSEGVTHYHWWSRMVPASWGCPGSVRDPEEVPDPPGEGGLPNSAGYVALGKLLNSSMPQFT